ncbi:hypothetical protein PARA125_000852 [Parachlamydia sp. AcF125]|nr:hypothetical protein [Parachlamydia sp. AcF125]
MAQNESILVYSGLKCLLGKVEGKKALQKQGFFFKYFQAGESSWHDHACEERFAIKLLFLSKYRSLVCGSCSKICLVFWRVEVVKQVLPSINQKVKIL